MIKVTFRDNGYSVAEIRDNRIMLVDLNSADTIYLTVDQFLNECDSIDAQTEDLFYGIN